MYPGLFLDLLNPGVNNLIILRSLSTRFSSTDLITLGILSSSITSDSIAKLWLIKSILHSSLSIDPTLVPSSKNALR